MKQISTLLKKGGVIIISTPNSRMCWRPALDFPPHHLSRFTPEALRGCVTRFGFEPIRLFQQMSSYDLIRNYVGTFFREKKIRVYVGVHLKLLHGLDYFELL